MMNQVISMTINIEDFGLNILIDEKTYDIIWFKTFHTKL